MLATRGQSRANIQVIDFTAQFNLWSFSSFIVCVCVCSGQILQVVRTANGAQYIIQPQQPIMVQQQVLPQIQASGVQSPVIQQVHTHVYIVKDAVNKM